MRKHIIISGSDHDKYIQVAVHFLSSLLAVIVGFGCLYFVMLIESFMRVI